MNWSDVANTVKDVAGGALPMLGRVLGGPMGEQAGSLVASALGVDDNPDEVAKAIQQDPDAVRKLKEAEMEHKRALQKMHLEAATAQQRQINKTMREELRSDNAFRASWRPLFGYGAALAWFLQIAAVIYVAIWNPENAAEITSAISDLTGMWAIALSVLGINISARSNDKKLAKGQDSRGVLSKLVDGFTGNKGG